MARLDGASGAASYVGWAEQASRCAHPEFADQAAGAADLGPIRGWGLALHDGPRNRTSYQVGPCATPRCVEPRGSKPHTSEAGRDHFQSDGSLA